MFGLFKSKEDKEVESIVSEIRQHRNEIIFDGNVVLEFSNKVMKKYKLVGSVIQKIKIAGVLSDFSDSGYVVIAISDREAMYINYDKKNNVTKIEIGSSSFNLLNGIKEGLSEFSLKAEKGHGMNYSDLGIINLIGAITVLGYEVGLPETEDENNFPFYYNNHKFYILDYDNKYSVQGICLIKV